MYTTTNFKTKKALKEAVAAGKKIGVYQEGPFATDTSNFTGKATCEGPWYPEPHKWYSEVTVVAGVITKVK